MIFFPKKNKLPKPTPNSISPSTIVEKPKEHKHHWQDFPPYITYDIDNSYYDIKIVEPYVCLDCKERKDEVLTQITAKGSHCYKEGMNQIQQLKEKYYGFIQDRLIVEDKIKDIINIDSEYNKYWRLIHGIDNPNGIDEFDSTPKLKL
jgi:hypothetical protein